MQLWEKLDRSVTHHVALYCEGGWLLHRPLKHKLCRSIAAKVLRKQHNQPCLRSVSGLSDVQSPSLAQSLSIGTSDTTGGECFNWIAGFSGTVTPPPPALTSLMLAANIARLRSVEKLGTFIGVNTAQSQQTSV